jgi:hypothetical protein
MDLTEIACEDENSGVNYPKSHPLTCFIMNCFEPSGSATTLLIGCYELFSVAYASSSWYRGLKYAFISRLYSFNQHYEAFLQFS